MLSDEFEKMKKKLFSKTHPPKKPTVKKGDILKSPASIKTGDSDQKKTDKQSPKKKWRGVRTQLSAKTILMDTYGIPADQVRKISEKKALEFKKSCEKTFKNVEKFEAKITFTGDGRTSILKKKIVKSNQPRPRSIANAEDTDRSYLVSLLKPAIKFRPGSTIASRLFLRKKVAPPYQDFTKFFEEQNSLKSSKEVEIVMGIDFGTTNTKLVIQESGTRRAWAVPLSTDMQNPYLLESQVFLNTDCYSLSGHSKSRISNLKLPLILEDYQEDHLHHFIGFLTLIIRQARIWFLQNAADNFSRATFLWSYNIGVPTANYEKEKLTELYRQLLRAAIRSANQHEMTVSKLTVATQFDMCMKKTYDVGTELFECNAYPEIQAQLHGYVRSDRYDPSRTKFMMVDVGGGTVDSSIINVTTDRYGEKRFSCLISLVRPIGVLRLHQTRLEWIRSNLDQYDPIQKDLIDKIEQVLGDFSGTELYPDSITDYLDNVSWPTHYCFDANFYKMYTELIFQESILYVKKVMDTERTQWESLQFVLCGGGSLHSLFNSVKSNAALDEIKLDIPEKFQAKQLQNTDYHRLSVAYGLSFEDLGTFIKFADIKPMEPQKKVDWQSKFIEK